MRHVVDSARPTGILARLLSTSLARWQSGYAAACKAVDAGSIPTLASKTPAPGIQRIPGAVVSVLILLGFFVLPHAALAADRDLEQQIDAYLKPYLDIGHLSGTILVAKNEDIIYQKSFGFADRDLPVHRNVSSTSPIHRIPCSVSAPSTSR